jgi:signal transduction histidine kinase
MVPAQAQQTGPDTGERTERTRTWMGAPLSSNRRSIGILSVSNHGPAAYTEQDLRNLQEFAHGAAIAIDNTRLYREAHVVAADEERSRLARELHDSVTQALFSASLISDVLPTLLRDDAVQAGKALDTLSRLTHGALAEMRSLLLELRPTDLASARLHTIIGQMGMAMTVKMPLEVSTSIDPCPRLPQNVQMALYRITQEALNNIVKHASASKVTISLQTTPPVSPANENSWQGTIALAIADNGVGFEADDMTDGRMGMASMAERARSIKASLYIDSGLGSGTRVAVSWRGAGPAQSRSYKA